MQRTGHKIIIPSTITNEVLKYVALRFIDDGDFSTLGKDKCETMDSMAHLHQQAVDCWSGGLRVTRGALNAAKCFWFPIDWK